jgi:hypothetical protein
MEYEEIEAPVVKQQKKAQGFSITKEELSVEIAVFETVEEPKVEVVVPIIKHHSQLVRPLTPKKTATRRGLKGASNTRP